MVCAGAGVSFYCKHVRDVFGFTLCQSFINPHGPLTAFPSRDQNSNMHSALKHIITPSLISMQSTWNACLQIVCTTNCFFDFSVDGVHCFKLTNFGRSAVGILTLCKLVFFVVVSGRFPGEHGVVAPGLSCQYPVKFAPDSLADYDDVIKVIVHVN